MRLENSDIDDAARMTFAIILSISSIVLNLALSILFNWGFMFLFIPEIIIGSMITASISYKFDTVFDFWKEGYKRKFKMFEGSEGKTFVETKKGFFWTPLWTITEVESEVRYDSKTGEKKTKKNYDRILMSFDSPTIAQEYIHKERGISSATPAGEFEA